MRDSNKYWLLKEDVSQEEGPYSREDLYRMWNEGILSPYWSFAYEGGTEWRMCQDLWDVFLSEDIERIVAEGD